MAKRIMYQVHSDENENNLFCEFYGTGAKQSAVAYAKEHRDEKTYVYKFKYNDRTEDYQYLDCVWDYAENEEEPIKVFLRESHGEIFIDYKTFESTRKSISIPKALGKENVHLNKAWTHHGGGGYYTWYTVINLEGAKQFAAQNGYEIIMMEEK